MLKSVVTASSRASAEAFYKVWSKAPVQFEYYLVAASALILVSFIGGTVQFPHKRIYNILSFACFSGAVGVYVGLVRPLLMQFQLTRSRKVDELVALLYSVALYQAIAGILVLLTTILQVSMDEAEEAEVPKKKKEE